MPVLPNPVMCVGGITCYSICICAYIQGGSKREKERERMREREIEGEREREREREKEIVRESVCA